MSQDALCAALPYAQCESPVPEAGVPSPLPQTTISYAGSQYSPPNTHPARGWYEAWHAINCFEPSSWRTPLNPLIAPQPVHPSSSTPLLLDTQSSPFPKHSLDEQEVPPTYDYSRTLSPNLPPRQTPSPLTPIPSPPPHVPIPHYRSLRSSTIWGPYLIKHGGYAKDLKSLDPTRKVKKPRRFRLTPEQRFEEDINLLTQIPTGGQRLTRSMFNRFEKHGRHPLRVTTTI
jgi:hypothetical protein